MVTFTLSWLGRDDKGRFDRKHRHIAADDVREVRSWLLHAQRHGRISLESDVRVKSNRIDIDTVLRV